jgi:hypothetical protein
LVGEANDLVIEEEIMRQKTAIVLILAWYLMIASAVCYAMDYVVDSYDNCIDLGSSCEDVNSKVVSLQTYRSVPYMLMIDHDHPPVCYNSAFNEFEGVFTGGVVGPGGDADCTWWHRCVSRETQVHIPAVDRHQNLFLFMVDHGNLYDNSGSFTVRLRPTAWGDMPVLPPPNGLVAAKSIVDLATGKIYVFGGGSTNADCYNSTWVLDPEFSGDWVEIPAGPDGPDARWHHCAIYDPNPDGNPRMVIFGGFTTTQNKYNDTWALDLVSKEWSLIEVTGEIPPPCNYHVGIYDPDGGPNPRMLVRGGHELGANTYALDFTTKEWSRIESGGGPSGGRAQSGGAFYHPNGENPRFLIFGGGYSSVYYNDLWSLDLETLEWTELSNNGSVGLPDDREGLSMAIDPVSEKLIVFGGRDADTWYNDVWCYDLLSDSWGEWRYPMIGQPDPRTLCACAYNVEHQALILGGGADGAGQPVVPAEVKVFVADFETVYYDEYPADTGDDPPVLTSTLAASAWPVPTTNGATIQYDLPAGESVIVSIVDASGRQVKLLENDFKPAGLHRVSWNRTDDRGSRVPRGVYFCRIRSESAEAVRKIVTVD